MIRTIAVFDPGGPTLKQFIKELERKRREELVPNGDLLPPFKRGRELERRSAK